MGYLFSRFGYVQYISIPVRLTCSELTWLTWLTWVNGFRHGMATSLADGERPRSQGKNGVVTPFSWMERLWVALDAACGLSHMHNSTPKAFHRDIKSANILLDRSGTAKMADFGLSGIAKNKNKLNMTCEQISGTPGYACPHYIKTGKVTEATEVYAYGMVVMEMLLNTMPACMGQNGTIMYPIFQIVMPQAEGALQRAVGAADAKAEWPPQVARDVAELSLVCSSHEENGGSGCPVKEFPMTSLLHYYRVADLHLNPTLQKKAAEVDCKMVNSEICYNIQASSSLDGEEIKKLEYLLRETFEPEKFGQKSLLSGSVVEVGPRQQFTSAWSTNAVSICHSIALPKIVRIEKSRRYQVGPVTGKVKSYHLKRIRHEWAEALGCLREIMRSLARILRAPQT
ncbi:unnamed protein product [Durusdinium trenchii]|uniref:Protein kinase domain-containing protein n=1 Tax=Durusdinium trenchii TaxID=1381693 RepID=A0ABP0SF39_9DINO